MNRSPVLLLTIFLPGQVQTVAALSLALFFKCNKIAAARGTWVTNPLYSPFVYHDKRAERRRVRRPKRI
ncbi:MAG: DUF2062 domain-containing protein [Desulfonatronovibrio sp.]